MEKIKAAQKDSRYFPHLNVSTNSNLSFSLIKIPQLVNWAAEQQLEYLAIADYYPYELLNFYNLCKEKKIKPIIGIKIIIQEEKQYLLTIYPQNSTGYKELIKKVFNEAPENRIFSLENIIPLKKNCLLIFVAHNLEEIKYFSQKPFFSSEKENNFYIGFDWLIKEPKKNIPSQVLLSLLPFFSVKSLLPKETYFLELLREGSLSQYFLTDDLWSKSTEFLYKEDFLITCTNDKIFAKVLLSQTQNFLSKINLKFTFSTKKSNSELEKRNFANLQDKCFKQLLLLQKGPREKYEKRLEEELEIINKLNYSQYFLIFNDIINHLKKENTTVGPGRGSSVSSLVAYLLGITKIDPLENHLFFERFLNEKRKNLPDIDIDVEKQEVVWDYLQKKYGEGKIAKIATRQKLGWKNAFRECTEAINKKKIRPLISEFDLKEILSFVKEDFLQENLKTKFFQDKFKLLFNMAEKIKDLFFNSSLHPSGIIISEKELLAKLIPLKKEKNFLISYCPEEELNLLGLKKYDFLSLNSLKMLNEIKKVLQKEHLPKCNFQDKETWKLINNCLLSDIPQLDTNSFRNLIFAFQPQNFQELVLLLALNRPGARQNMETITLQRKKGQTKFFSSPVLNQILGESYGSIVFEEQVSQIFTFVFDCSFAEAEIQRRSLSKLKEDKLEIVKKSFLENAQKKITLDESKKLWEQIIRNNAYTFNKAHAVAYTYLCYYIAYLKANYFSSLITFYLDNCGNSPEKTSLYLQEALFYGFACQKVDINFSEIQWTKKGKKLFMGFSSLRNYHPDFFQAIIEERKKRLFKDWEDLINRTSKKWEKIELFTFQKWIETELFASLKIKANILLKYKEVIFRYLKLRQKFPSALRDLPPLDWAGFELNETNNNKLNFLLINQNEQENLGIYISYFNRWKEIKDKLTGLSLTVFADFISSLSKSNNLQDSSLSIYAIIKDIQPKRDGFYLTLQDFRSTLKLIINNEFYQQNQQLLKIHQEVLWHLFIKLNNQQVKSIQVQKVELVE